MTEELTNRISQCIQEELDDSKKYEELADHAHELGAYDVCRVFRDLANEEKTHAAILESFMK